MVKFTLPGAPRLDDRTVFVGVQQALAGAVESQICLSSLGIRAVTPVAAIGQDRFDVEVVIDFHRQLSRGAHIKAAQKQER